MSNLALTRTLYSTKSMNIRSFMRLPEVYLAGSTATVSTFPVLFITYQVQVPYENRHDPKPKDTSFKINSRNLYRTVKFFRKILSWFEEDQYRDLFIVDEHDGNLIVNMDFKNLRANVEGNRLDAQAMMAVPAVVTNDSVQSEGCVLIINRTNYSIALTDKDVESIYGILSSFSFQQETMLLLQLASMKALRTTEPPRFGRTPDMPKPKVVW